MRRGFILSGIFVLLLLLAVSSVWAEPQHKASGKASLSGIILGPDDKPVPHAAVTYQSSGGNAPHAIHADAHGRFTIANLRGDNYEIRASAHGVFSEWEKNVNVRPGQQKTITLRLIYAREMPKSEIPVKKKQ
ncbi:MAG TPA: carboxypeptidase-like regulatory domain-containing protein [Candidatus Dormibacteraeota bacterium]|jgi:hypothetical protein|nr:carboxypeptidase-like regulatory domain-containing protein [Candidatus Dormibacteraeota bacterium]